MVGMLGTAQCFKAPKSGCALNHPVATSLPQTAFSKISEFKSQGYPLYVISSIALNVYAKAQTKFHLLRAKEKSKNSRQTTYMLSICKQHWQVL